MDKIPIFFSCEDHSHYIYWLQSNMNNSDLEELDLDTFLSKISSEKSPIWLQCANKAEVLGIICGSEYTALIDLKTVGETLHLE